MIAIIDYGAGNIFSVKNALDYLGFENKLTDKKEDIEKADAIILPGVGAFPWAMNMLGLSGLIDTIKEQAKIKPFLGICLGMQIAVIEYARNVAGIADADSGEFNELCKHKVIDFMPGQSDSIDKGGTLRLGAYPCMIKSGTAMERCYGKATIFERHRHRYEFNNDYRDTLTAAGLTLSGLSPDGRLVETVELTDRPFHIGVQYHPEFKSRPNRAHPLFFGFVKAALERKETT